MNENDPRHGTNAGAVAHEKLHEPLCPPCKWARTRFRKHVAAAKRRGERIVFTADELREAMSPWLGMGLTPSAVANAAGLTADGGHIAIVLSRNQTVRRSTFRAIAGVSEDDFSAYAKVHADLTRRRIYSLMAAGHRLDDMPINRSGHWRTTGLVTVGTARNIREHYLQNEGRVGTHQQSMSRARNAGHRPPLSWDDPGTLAWIGEPPQMGQVQRVDSDVDRIVVERIVAGERIEANAAERAAACELAVKRGMSLADLGRRAGFKPDRYYKIGDAA